LFIKKDCVPHENGIGTVPTGEIGTVYQFLALLLMALRDFSFYFLISNLVAVVLRFLEGVRNKTGNTKKMRHPYM
jgi:hypothetical protein